MATAFKVSGKLFELVELDEVNQIVVGSDENQYEYIFNLSSVDCWLD